MENNNIGDAEYCNNASAQTQRTAQTAVRNLPPVTLADVRPGLASELQPILKWPGGKESELKYILPNTPRFDRFFEPFVGGGSVFMGINAREYFINDFSAELIELYNNIAHGDDLFFACAEAIDASWLRVSHFCNAHPELLGFYTDYRDGIAAKELLEVRLQRFCLDNQDAILNLLDPLFEPTHTRIVRETESNLLRKMLRMSELEHSKHPLPEKDIRDNIETAMKSAMYMTFRHMYNDRRLAVRHPQLRCALFLFIRNYAYSGMFRYSRNGDFNVPYGGMAYNSKMMARKLDYYRSAELLGHFAATHIFNMDFEAFLEAVQPQPQDFVFLDPPYDSEFSTYTQNAFTRQDQIRLADYMTRRCPAQWMMIIKNTDFIFDLYNRRGINIRTFDKKYLVSFMNRNDKAATHLLITNY